MNARPHATDAGFSKTTWQFRDAGEFGTCRAQWEQILAGHSAKLGYDFLFTQTLVRHYSRRGDVLVTGRDGDGPVLITLMRRTGPGRWETFCPSQSLLGLWLQRRDTPMETLLIELAARLPGPVFLVSLLQQDPLFIEPPENTSRVVTVDHYQTAAIRLEGTFDQYWAARIKKLRYEMDRRRRRLAESGVEVSFDERRDEASVAGFIGEYGALESRGWKGKEGTAIEARNEQGEFYTALMRTLCAEQRGRMYRLCYNGKAAAMQLGLASGDGLVFLKTTYDETQRAFSPGLMMKAEILKGVFSPERAQRAEFYGPLKGWQTDWSHEVRRLYHVNFYRHAAFRKLRDGLRVIWR